MTVTEPPNARIPVICTDPSTVAGAEISNPNEWATDSKGLVRSCLAEFSVLCHCVGQIAEMCKDPGRLCEPHIAAFQCQWTTAKFDLGKSCCSVNSLIYTFE